MLKYPVVAAIKNGKKYIGFRLSTTTPDRYDMGSLAQLPEPSIMIELIANPPNLNAIWGSDAHNIYAVGNQGTIAHYNGANWTQMESGTKQDLNDVFGISAEKVFVVENKGPFCSSMEKKWAPMESKTVEDLNAVWASSTENVFALAGMD